MNSHLVTVEVGVKRSTYEGVKSDSSTLNQDRLECLNTQSVQCRCTVEEYGMLFDYFF